MADEPDNLVLGMLTDIRAKQDEHSTKLGALEKQMFHVEQQLDDLTLQATYAMGLATSANLKVQTTSSKADDLTHKLDEVIARVEALETR